MARKETVMNNTITLEPLVKQVALRASVDYATAQLFIETLISKLPSLLQEAPHDITIPTLGTFSLLVPEGSVTFVPSTEMAEAVNEPFSFFQPTILVEELEPPVTHCEPESTVTPTQEAVSEGNIEEISDSIQDFNTVIETHKEQSDCNPSNERTDFEDEEDDEEEANYTDDENEDDREDYFNYNNEEENRSEELSNPNENRGLLSKYILTYAAGLITGVLISCTFVYNSNHRTDTGAADADIMQNKSTIFTDTTDTVTILTPETSTSTVKNIETTTKPKTEQAQQDTVTARRFLATMAREYYGKMEFWAYIYKENEARLGHPDRIPTGTVVTIPPAAKYNIDANNPASLKRAKELIDTIYIRFARIKD